MCQANEEMNLLHAYKLLVIYSQFIFLMLCLLMFL